MLAQDRAKGSDFHIDGAGAGAFPVSGSLVAADIVGGYVRQQQLPEDRQEMATVVALDPQIALAPARRVSSSHFFMATLKSSG